MIQQEQAKLLQKKQKVFTVTEKGKEKKKKKMCICCKAMKLIITVVLPLQDGRSLLCPHIPSISYGIIWNYFGWSPTHFAVIFHIHSIWKDYGISEFQKKSWNIPLESRWNIQHLFHLKWWIPSYIMIFHMDFPIFHMDSTTFHMNSTTFHNISKRLYDSFESINKILYFVQLTGSGHMTCLN